MKIPNTIGTGKINKLTTNKNKYYDFCRSN